MSFSGRIWFLLSVQALGAGVLASQQARAAPAYDLYVTNEKSDDVTVIDGTDRHVVGTIAVGKRPRGIHVSPDGRMVYVAVSGTPVAGPPELDPHGNPVLKKKPADDADDATGDKAADGIAIVDARSRKFSRKVAAGSDPEEFAVSKDGARIYISNEDSKSATVINIATGKLEHSIPVGAEPEGVTTTPDGKFFYVTCEAGGDVYIVDTAAYGAVAHFKVEGRPRSVDFSRDGRIAFVPSESVGQVNIVDTATRSVSKKVALPAGSRPMLVKVAPDGGRVYVSNGRGGTVSVLDGGTYEVIGSIPVGIRPWGMAISPDGKWLYVANGPSNDVSVVDLGTQKEVTRVKAGLSPWGLAIVPRAP